MTSSNPISNEERRAHMIRSVETYFEACNRASRELFAQVLTERCVHYFPPGTGGPYLGREAIADLWIGFVREKDSRWTIDRLVCDGRNIAVEWTHWKPAVGEHIRGSEWYEFDEHGKIDAIWAHYASSRDAGRPANELEGFTYRGRGYPLTPPDLDEARKRERANALTSEPTGER
jgi:hypothetical protein